MQLQGVKPGVADLFFAYPNRYWYGFFIELKARRNSRVTEQQKDFLSLMEKVGYRIIVAYGWEEAKDHLIAYLYSDDF